MTHRYELQSHLIVESMKLKNSDRFTVRGFHEIHLVLYVSLIPTLESRVLWKFCFPDFVVGDLERITFIVLVAEISAHMIYRKSQRLYDGQRMTPILWINAECISWVPLLLTRLANSGQNFESRELARSSSYYKGHHKCSYFKENLLIKWMLSASSSLVVLVDNFSTLFHWSSGYPSILVPSSMKTIRVFRILRSIEGLVCVLNSWDGPFLFLSNLEPLLTLVWVYGHLPQRIWTCLRHQFDFWWDDTVHGFDRSYLWTGCSSQRQCYFPVCTANASLSLPL